MNQWIGQPSGSQLVPHRVAAMRMLVVLWALLAVFLMPSGARAQGIESVLSPGRLSQAHAKWENDCKSCHVRFDRAAQDKVCMDCHKDLAQDVRSKTGFHGRMRPQQCRSCHTEHNGLNGKLIELDERKFDHALTDFGTLRGKHQQTTCNKCHEPGKKHRLAPQDCFSCHKKDDHHKGGLGPKCGDCHNENTWKERRFDHNKTNFPLTGKHTDAGCTDCHRNNQYKGTAQTCFACHKNDDDQNGHRGQFGTKCETCHTTAKWEQNTFNHDTDTNYPLLGKHQPVECTACHLGPLFSTKMPTACYECHKKDDTHRESLGRNCGNCHTERGWREPAKFDHDRTRFPLRNAHANPKVRCESCHRDLRSMRNTPRDCYSCHKKDDKHEGTQGRQCDQCHNDRSFKVGEFDHARTAFPLTGRHVTAACKDCHKTKVFKNTDKQCISCHKKDDRHKQKFGTKCESCHVTRTWGIWTFDHDKHSSFKLDRTHKLVACEKCHTRPAPNGAAVASLGNTCVSCHRGDDAHDGAFGPRCESCHTSDSWKKVKNTRITGGLQRREAWQAALGQASYFNKYAAAGSTPAGGWMQ